MVYLLGSHDLTMKNRQVETIPSDPGRMRLVICLALALVCTIPSAQALDEPRTARLIWNITWTYEQAWIVHDIIWDDTNAIIDAAVPPILIVLDNATIRTWPMVADPVVWGANVFACNPFLPDYAGCVADWAASSPDLDLDPAYVAVGAAPGDLERGVAHAAAETPGRTMVLLDDTAASGDLIASRWVTDILALLS